VLRRAIHGVAASGLKPSGKSEAYMRAFANRPAAVPEERVSSSWRRPQTFFHRQWHEVEDQDPLKDMSSSSGPGILPVEQVHVEASFTRN